MRAFDGRRGPWVRPQAVGRECNASPGEWPVGVQGEAACERSPWAAAAAWKSPPGRGGLQII